MKEPIYIVDGTRSPFTKAGTNMAALSVADLGKATISALLAQSGLDPAILDEVIIGCVGQPADAANVGRVIALRSGIPQHVPAITVHRNCASGFEAVTQAADKIAAGRGHIYLAAGCESMSSYPLLYNKSATAKFAALMKCKSATQRIGALMRFRPSDFKPKAGLMLGLTDPVCGMNMGQTAEVLARDFDISREEQDMFALESHLKAAAARDSLSAEISTVYPGNGDPVCSDNGIREKQTMDALAKLKAVFEKDGTVTAGNASQITDGAAALIIASESACEKYKLSPIGRLNEYAYSGCEPKRMGLGPVHAIDKLEKRSGMSLEYADLIEINEAFSAQVIAVMKAMESDTFCKKHLNRDTPIGSIDKHKLNVNGGGIALGHPVGATGSRLILSSLKELKRRNRKRALLSLCIGGGQGGALWIEAM